ncbi:MAG: bifunctional (p)ppGpp synthetase/guanosine-3',5'-bis(diphosphate) 3'-pyrophosphohydrolase [Deltaproteobacteria bacterium]|nr:bifunctional (p)ppGpp synthetase/guanosine-3',5'-bis(diphosphate) 3'-pyrophosphohydrolase [Deltaproteobacteria bacterium]
MIRITDILDKVQQYNPEADFNIIDKAYIFSARSHAGQVRLSGEPYLSHPLEVAGILADMKLDTVSIAAGLLHDVIEDSKAEKKEIAEVFGAETAHIVEGVTKLSELNFRSDQEREAESIRKMILAMADDIRVILIKLADRIHNMRTLGYHPTEKKKRKIAKETLDIYAPITARLGIKWMKIELEDTAFKYLQPAEYTMIKNMVAKSKEERSEYVEKVKLLIKNEIKAAGLKCEVLGRFKYFYSIYNKMRQQNLEFEEVYDIIAFRIILDTVHQCYEALGIIHSLWKPIPKKFKDYIGSPKPNMYQSLHTTVVSPYGERVEIQIRTWEMDETARLGIAAHWSYKEGIKADEKTEKIYAWLQEIIENQKNIKDSKEFMENIKIDLFPDEVYIFTPLGEIKSFPKGATPIDFAYSIHTEVGNECVGAKVNGRMIPLKYQLNIGDIVTVLTKKGGRPSKDWLGFVKTVRARSKIRQSIKTEERKRSITLGREMCEKLFRKNKLNFNSFAKSEDMEKVIEALGFKTLDDLIASVGYGKTTPAQIIGKLQAFDEAKDEDKQEAILSKIAERPKKRKDKSGIIVKGLDDILIRFGNCCQPVPGEHIVGYITRGYGVTIHRTDCTHALNMNPERRIEADWGKEDKQGRYPAKLKIVSYDRVGLLADLTACMKKNDSSIEDIKIDKHPNKTADCIFFITVRDNEHLKEIISDLKRVKTVQFIQRL